MLSTITALLFLVGCGEEEDVDASETTEETLPIEEETEEVAEEGGETEIE